MSDTVGFIRNLPHTLVSAFRATLEEVQNASLIVEVSDVASPVRAEQETQVADVLRELSADSTPRLMVRNKIDTLPSAERKRLNDHHATVHVSAIQREGLDSLLEHIDSMLEQDPISRIRWRIPQSAGKALAQVEAGARVHHRHYGEGYVELEADAPESLVRKLRDFELRGRPHRKRARQTPPQH